MPCFCDRSQYLVGFPAGAVRLAPTKRMQDLGNCVLRDLDGIRFFQVLKRNPIRATTFPRDQEFPTSRRQLGTTLPMAVLDETVVL